MKKNMFHKFSSLLFVALCCVSCSHRNEDTWKKEVKEALTNLSSTEYTSYSVSPSGDAHYKTETEERTFYQFNTPESSYAVPSGTYDSIKKTYDNGSSYLMLIPIRITADTFMSSDEQDTGSCYKSLNEMFCYYADHITTLQFRKLEDGGFEFYTQGVSKLSTFYHLYTTDGPEDDYLQVHGRFDMTATYSSSGLLLKERYHTIDSDTRKDAYVDIQCTYTYH
jgi:hypothetical protein